MEKKQEEIEDVNMFLVTEKFHLDTILEWSSGENT